MILRETNNERNHEQAKPARQRQVDVRLGGKKIGEFGKGLGEGIRNFKTAMKEDKPNGKPATEPDKIEAKQ